MYETIINLKNKVGTRRMNASTGCLRRNEATLSSFSSGSMEQVLYTRIPPGFTNLQIHNSNKNNKNVCNFHVFMEYIVLNSSNARRQCCSDSVTS